MQTLATTPYMPPQEVNAALCCTRDHVRWIIDTIAQLAAKHAPAWTPPQRHFLAAFLAATDAAVLLHGVMDATAHSRESILVLFNSRVNAHAAALGVESASVGAAGGGAGAGAWGAQLRATLAARKLKGHAESAWVAAAVWTLLNGLCKRAHSELGWRLLGNTLKLPGAKKLNCGRALLICLCLFRLRLSLPVKIKQSSGSVGRLFESTFKLTSPNT